MSVPLPSWEGLDAAEPSSEERDAAIERRRCYVRAFNSNSGAVVLEALKALTVDRVLPANASDAELRYVEGQRWLYRHICHEIEMGSKE